MTKVNINLSKKIVNALFKVIPNNESREYLNGVWLETDIDHLKVFVSDGLKIYYMIYKNLKFDEKRKFFISYNNFKKIKSFDAFEYSLEFDLNDKTINVYNSLILNMDDTKGFQKEFDFNRLKDLHLNQKSKTVPENYDIDPDILIELAEFMKPLKAKNTLELLSVTRQSGLFKINLESQIECYIVFSMCIA